MAGPSCLTQRTLPGQVTFVLTACPGAIEEAPNTIPPTALFFTSSEIASRSPPGLLGLCSLVASSIDESCGAPSARPPSTLSPMHFMCLSRRSAGTCFVIMSAGLSTPGTLVNAICLDACACCTHRDWVSTCLSFPMPRLWAIPSAADASVNTLGFSSIPKSRP